ncbi:hypothetical protein A8926_5939 [Saccharopolyspora spinosa]|uniref:Uncharacterized protein n=1 Tax=Saccharopolyspora spinosa TaxID=60894 RepID=A0A2N3Y502_SACSN|nr:hypothetical protein A8926_5939 [Saccharopolyspora spinosa]
MVPSSPAAWNAAAPASSIDYLGYKSVSVKRDFVRS